MKNKRFIVTVHHKGSKSAKKYKGSKTWKKLKLPNHFLLSLPDYAK